MKKQAPSLFVLHAENKAFIQNKVGTPPTLGLSVTKTALITLLLFMLPSLIIMIGVGFYLINNDVATLSPLLLMATVIGFIAGIGIFIYSLYVILNTALKVKNLNSKGQLLGGRVQALKINKESLEDEHTSESYFLILKITYRFVSPKSGKTIDNKVQKRYLPDDLDHDVAHLEGKKCAIYYASDRHHVLL